MKLAMDVDGWWTDVDCAHVDVFILVSNQSIHHGEIYIHSLMTELFER